MTDLEIPEDDRINQLIWKWVGRKSIRQIAEEVGLPVDEVMRRRREMAESIDVLSLEDEMQKALLEWKQVAALVLDKIDNVQDERNFSGIINSFNGLNKNIVAEINRLKNQNSEAVDSLNQMRVRELLSLLEETAGEFIPWLVEQYGVMEEEAGDKLHELLAKAAEKRDLT